MAGSAGGEALVVLNDLLDRAGLLPRRVLVCEARSSQRHACGANCPRRRNIRRGEGIKRLSERAPGVGAAQNFKDAHDTSDDILHVDDVAPLFVSAY